MICRKATVEDVPRLVEMGQNFLRSSKYAEILQDDPEAVGKTFRMLIDGLGAVAVLENGQVQGMFAFTVLPHFFSSRQKFATEIAWWIEPEARQAEWARNLWEYAETLAEGMGAQKMQMGAPDEKVARLYRMRGYRQTEACYEKRLGAA